MVAFISIIFNEVVNIDDTIAVLKEAAANGTLGDLEVDPGSIRAIRPVVTQTTSPSTQATSPLKVTTSSTTSATLGRLIRDRFVSYHIYSVNILQ